MRIFCATLAYFLLWPSMVSASAVLEGDAPPRHSDLAAISTHARRSRFLRAKHKRAGADVYYVAKALDKLKVATAQQQMNAEKRFNLEQERLGAAMQQSLDHKERVLLALSIQNTEENRMEEMNAFKAMYNMYYTLKAGVGAASQAPSCDFLTCGEHADCVVMKNVASCSCRPCFEGNGFQCQPTTCAPQVLASAQPMFLHITSGAPSMEDVSVAVFQQNRIAAAYRETKQNNVGFLMIGTAGEAQVSWGQPQKFSKDIEAYDPVIVVTPTGRIVVEFRDDPKDGVGYLVGGRIDETDPFTTIMLDTAPFTKGQFEPVSMVMLASSRVACLYSHPKVGKEDAYGGALLFQVAKGGTLSIMGKYRFADHPVSFVAATALRPTSFVVAFRDPPGPDEASDAYSRELTVVWMGVSDDMLVLDPHPLVLDEKLKDMGMREVSLVSENLIAYTYQSLGERKTKMAIVRVDPNTHRMKLEGGPKELAYGDTQFIKGVSTPYMSLAPHSFAYIQHVKKPSVAKTCRISPRGLITECDELAWSNTVVNTVSAAKLGDGRLVFIYSDAKREPFCQLIASPA